MYSRAHFHTLPRGLSCHVVFLGETGTYTPRICFFASWSQDLNDMADEYWTKNTNGQFSKKKFKNAIWEAAYRRHMDGTLTTTIYECSAEPLVVAEETNVDTQHMEVLDDEADELEDQMRKMVLSLKEKSSDETAQLARASKMFEGAPALESEGAPASEIAEEHANRWVEESMSREMLEKITWAAYCPQDRKSDLIMIFKLGMKYVDAFNNAVIQPWNVEEVPTHMRPWLAELDLTLKKLMSRNWLPRQLRCPHDRYIRVHATGAEGDPDPGNGMYDIIVNMMRLWQAVDENHWEQVVKVAGKEYGERGNKSSAGPVNLRGNMIEALLRWLQEMSATPSHLRPHQQWSCEEWYTWNM